MSNVYGYSQFLCKRRYGRYLLAFLVSIAWATTANAAQNNQTGIGISFHGKLKRAPCHINNDKLIKIHFNKVGINKVDGINYAQKIDYSITCDAIGGADKMMLSVNGSVSTYDSAALQTDVSDLGIKIYQNGVALELNKPIAIDPEHHPELTAVPVQKPGAVLTPQDFRVTATLLAEYQ